MTRAVVPFMVGAGIVYFGTRTGGVSTSQSEFVTKIVQNVGIFRNLDFDTAMLIVRKMAHMFEYCLFAGSMNWALRKSIGGKAKYASFVTAFLLASCDELIQFSQEGRIGCVEDVLIDSLGAIIGICLYNLLSKHT